MAYLSTILVPNAVRQVSPTLRLRGSPFCKQRCFLRVTGWVSRLNKLTSASCNSCGDCSAEEQRNDCNSEQHYACKFQLSWNLRKTRTGLLTPMTTIVVIEIWRHFTIVSWRNPIDSAPAERVGTRWMGVTRRMKVHGGCCSWL